MVRKRIDKFENLSAVTIPSKEVELSAKRTRLRNAEKPFIVWDGEGVTHAGDTRQSYVLFGHSEADPIIGRKLTTMECLRFMIQAAKDFPDAIHVGFAFNYDVNMILNGLRPHQFERLAEHGSLRYGPYWIEHVPSKWFKVSETDPYGNRTSIKISDTFGFFQTSLLKALKSYIPDSPLMAELDIVETGKAGRKEFAFENIDDIRRYWKIENDLFKELVYKLRNLMYSVGLNIGQWHGPGVLANYVYSHNRIAEHKDETRSEVREAARYAYAGGRFELFRMGRHTGPVYGLDINSAYPAAISQLPSLTEGRWRYVDHPTEIQEFGVYHIRLNQYGEFVKPSPLFHRDPKHNISFPWLTEGWYWSPEVVSLLNAPNVEIVGGWEYVDFSTRPFEFVRDMYTQRREMKAKGIGSEKALKLALNSLYGKMAQRAGWQHTGDAPRWHQLSWAGYVTSATRAQLFSMLARIPAEHLIGVETDGIYTTYDPALLGVTNSSLLGEWEINNTDSNLPYEEMLYAQSGVYFYKQNGKWTGKYRGLDSGSLTAPAMEEYLKRLQPDSEWEPISGPTTRFIGYKAALMRQRLGDGEALRFHRQWETSQRDIRTGAVGKRVHRPDHCNACQLGATAYEMPHQLSINSLSLVNQMSTMHDIPWETNITNADWRALSEWNNAHVHA